MGRILGSTVIALGVAAAIMIVGQWLPVAFLIVLVPGAMIGTLVLLVLDTLGLHGLSLPLPDEFDGPAQFMLISLAFGQIFLWTVIYWAMSRRSQRLHAIRPPVETLPT